MHHLFISYSRRDRAFVERLSKALEDRGKKTWVDWHDIPPTATFMDEIRVSIDASDSFLFVISPDSCHSSICRQELAHAAKSQKRLIPIVCKPTPESDVPAEVAPINWIWFTDDHPFDAGIAQLTTALETDLKWVRAHTELLVRAKEWEELERTRGALLRGIELTTAEQNLVSEAGKLPLVVPLQQEFVVASRQNATRTLRNIVGAVTTALIVTVVLAGLAFRLSRLAEARRSQAEEQRRNAETQRNLADDRRREADEQRKNAETQRNLANDRRKEANEQADIARQQRDRAERETKRAEAATAVATEQREAAIAERNRAEDTARMITARSLIDTDPTSAALLVQELHDAPGRGLAAASVLRAIAEHPIATAVMRGPTGNIFNGAFSPDGQHVVTLSGDGTASIWRTDGLGRPTVLQANAGTGAPTFSPDGRSVLIMSTDGTARIWPTAGDGKAIILRGHTGRVRSARFSHDGARVVTLGDDGTARLWSSDGAELATARPPDGETRIRDAAFTVGGMRVLGTTKNVAIVWPADRPTAPLMLRGHTGEIASAAFSSDGTRVVTASGDATVRIWRMDGSGDALVLRGPVTGFSSAMFSPDGSRVIAIVGYSIITWAASGAGQPVVRHSPDDIMSFSLSPDGSRIVTVHDTRNFQTAHIWRTDVEEPPIALGGHSRRVYFAAFSGDGTKIVTAGNDASVRVWGVGNREPFVIGNHETYINDAQFDRAGTRVVTASDDKTARVWSLARAEPPLVLTGHTQIVTTAVFSPDGRQVVTTSDDGSARVWDLAAPGTPLVLDLHAGPMDLAWFTEDGQQVVTLTRSGVLGTWSLADPSKPAARRSPPITELMELHNSKRTFVTPDGRRTVSGTEDAIARVSDADGHEEPLILQLPQDQNIVRSASFSPNGARVITRTFTTSHRPNDVRVWRVDVATLLSFLRQSTTACLSPPVRSRALGEADKVASDRYEACERAKDAQ